MDLALDGPHVVLHHLLVGLEHALDAHRLEGELALGAVIQLGFHQPVSVAVLQQRHEFNEGTSKQNDGNGRQGAPRSAFLDAADDLLNGHLVKATGRMY